MAARSKSKSKSKGAGAKKKPSRRPKRAAKKKSKSPKRRVRVDPVKDYREAIGKDGIARVVSLESPDSLSAVPGFVSTQCLAMDRILTGGGWPMSRLVEIFGPFHIGKSTLIDHAFAQVQSMGGLAILFDVEAARHVIYSRAIGVKTDLIQCIEFPPGKLTLEAVLDKLVETVMFWASRDPTMPIVVGIDAIGGTPNADTVAGKKKKKKKKEGEDEDESEVARKGKPPSLGQDGQPAEAAKLLRKACRLLPQYLGRTSVAVLLANHEYQKFSFGFASNSKETYGGEAIRLLSTIRVRLHPIKEGWIKRSDGTILGRVIGCELVKNKLGGWARAQIPIISGAGVNNVWTLYEDLKSAGIIVAGGSWSAINLDGEDLKWQGWTGLDAKCREDETLYPRLVSVWKSLPGN